MEKELTVGQVMAPIEEYNTVPADAPLCDALFILKANMKKIEIRRKRTFSQDHVCRGFLRSDRWEALHF